MSDELVKNVAHEVVQPQGYTWSIHAGGVIPWFDNEGRKIVLLCHPDGSVTWELRGKNGEVLEP